METQGERIVGTLVGTLLNLGIIRELRRRGPSCFPLARLALAKHERVPRQSQAPRDLPRQFPIRRRERYERNGDDTRGEDVCEKSVELKLEPVGESHGPAPARRHDRGTRRD